MEVLGFFIVLGLCFFYALFFDEKPVVIPTYQYELVGGKKEGSVPASAYLTSLAKAGPKQAEQLKKFQAEYLKYKAANPGAEVYVKPLAIGR